MSVYDGISPEPASAGLLFFFPQGMQRQETFSAACLNRLNVDSAAENPARLQKFMSHELYYELPRFLTVPSSQPLSTNNKSVSCQSLAEAEAEVFMDPNFGHRRDSGFSLDPASSRFCCRDLNLWYFQWGMEWTRMFHLFLFMSSGFSLEQCKPVGTEQNVQSKQHPLEKTIIGERAGQNPPRPNRCLQTQAPFSVCLSAAVAPDIHWSLVYFLFTII